LAEIRNPQTAFQKPMPVFQLSEDIVFPSPHLASREGLLAVGGDLSVERLLLAYSSGIFPWYSDGEPILWWSPDPRLVLYPNELKISRSLRKVIRQDVFDIHMDRAFETVISECAQVRLENQESTWIVDDMVRAYCRLHGAGFAHSVEAWQGNALVGGLYGVSIGKCFFGESMYTRVTNASKVALVALVEHVKPLGFAFIDCQIPTAHLFRLGAREISRSRYLGELTDALRYPTQKGQWTFQA
jgi:leucyl/phenylalanyl-tRNA--protein transferase